MIIPSNSSHSPTVLNPQEMSYDPIKPTTATRTTPVVSKRARAGPYVAPRLANSAASASAPELIRDARPTARSSIPSKDETTTPIKNFLNSNVTPRSATRSARVNSPASTPGGTPAGTPLSSRPTSTVVARDNILGDVNGNAGFTIIPSGPRLGRSGSTASVGLSGLDPMRGISPERLIPTGQIPSPEQSPMFFHASEAKQLPAKQASSRLQNSTQGPSRSSTGSVAASPPNEKSQRKFYHANGMPEKLSPKSGKVSTNPPLRPSARLSKPANNPHRNQTRSTSPLKKDHTVPSIGAAQRRSPQSNVRSQANGTKSRSPSTSTSIKTPPGRLQSSRSPESTPSRHSKNDSIGSTTTSRTTSSATRRRSSLEKVETIIPPPPIPSPPTITSPPAIMSTSTASSLATITSPPAITSPPTVVANPSKNRPPLLPPIETSRSSVTSPTSPLLSPTRIMAPKSESKIEELNRLAANARRERKVLDLEISNSSLLAINRTLEREIRKQTSELRRYRRLTSAGRISLPRRSASSRFSGITTTDDGLSFGTPSVSDSDETESFSGELDTIEDEIEDEDTSTNSDEPLSLEAQKLRDARRRAADEKRLQLDLTKHQEILIESQKMNQSLKRCLGWTEELIKEGKKALAYEVRISDVEIGGRILREDEIDVELDTRKALLSPGLDKEGFDSMQWGPGDNDNDTFSPPGTAAGNDLDSDAVDGPARLNERLASLVTDGVGL